jgi:hypothetical protein
LTNAATDFTATGDANPILQWRELAADKGAELKKSRPSSHPIPSIANP